MLWFTTSRYCTSGNNSEAWSPFGHFHQFASFCCGNVGHQNWCWELHRDAKNGLGLHLGISKTAPWEGRCFCQSMTSSSPFVEVLLQPGQVCLNSSQARRVCRDDLETLDDKELYIAAIHDSDLLDILQTLYLFDLLCFAVYYQYILYLDLSN